MTRQLLPNRPTNTNNEGIHVLTHKYNWYFGWNIVAAATLLTLITVGMRMGIGPFILPMLKDVDFNRSDLSGIIAIGMLCYGIGMPIAGYLVNRKGTRFVLLLGTCIVVISAIWTAFASHFFNMLCAFGISLSLGLALTSPIALTPILSRWFTRRRGMALFFLSTGSMAGIAIMTPVFTFAIEQFGWRQTMIGYAIVFAVIAIPTILLIIRDEAPLHTDLLTVPTASTSTVTISAATPHQLTIKQAIQTVAYWQICLGLFACGFSMNLLGTHGVPMLIDHHFSPSISSLGIGTIGLVAIFSSLLLGRIADLLERRNLLACIYFVRGLGFFALVAVISPWQLFLVAAIGGMVWSGSVALSSAILADLYGTRLVGILYGWAYLGHQIGAMVSSWLGGWTYEHYHSHWIAFGSAGILLLLVAAISLSLPTTKRV